MASEPQQGRAEMREPGAPPRDAVPAWQPLGALPPSSRPRRGIPLPLFVAASVATVLMTVLWATTRADLHEARGRLAAIEEAEAALPDLQEVGLRHLRGTGAIEDAGPDYLSANFSGTSGLAELEDLLADLGFSAAVMRRIGNTRALDGTQTADAPHVVATWTYHPDDGLNIVFERTGA